MAFEAVKVDVISRSLIKPSSPTPDHLRRLNLSVFDQVAPPAYIPILFFYEADELKGLSTSTDHAGLSKNLQESLSATLTSFYPLAGKLNVEDFSVTCNDVGVEFIEARAHSRIEDLLIQKELAQIQEYFPATLFSGESKLFIVQINYFDCGGIAIGTCMSHIIADGWSTIGFMNSWAATCRGENRDSPYKFGPLGKTFPARDLSELNLAIDHIVGSDQHVRKRFIFDNDQLAALKTAAAAGDDSVVNPTRVEALSAFIWKNSIENYAAEGKKHFAARHMVNIRSKGSISLQDVIGNGVLCTTAYFNLSDVDLEGGPHRPPSLPNLVSELRKAIRKIDDEYIEKTRTELLCLRDLEHDLDLLRSGEVDELLMFSSWSRFPIYDADFGWGRPAWVAFPAVPVNNFAVFLSTRDGQGIEVWINLPPQHAVSLENKHKLIGLECLATV